MISDAPEIETRVFQHIRHPFIQSVRFGMTIGEGILGNEIRFRNAAKRLRQLWRGNAAHRARERRPKFFHFFCLKLLPAVVRALDYGSRFTRGETFTLLPRFHETRTSMRDRSKSGKVVRVDTE